MEYYVKKLRHVRDYVVHFTFADGTEREIDLLPFLFGGIFDELRAPEAFLKFKLDRGGGTIAWPNGADIAPETLYYDLGVPEAEKQSTATQK